MCPVRCGDNAVGCCHASASFYEQRKEHIKQKDRPLRYVRYGDFFGGETLRMTLSTSIHIVAHLPRVSMF